MSPKQSRPPVMRHVPTEITDRFRPFMVDELPGSIRDAKPTASMQASMAASLGVRADDLTATPVFWLFESNLTVTYQTWDYMPNTVPTGPSVGIAIVPLNTWLEDHTDLEMEEVIVHIARHGYPPLKFIRYVWN